MLAHKKGLFKSFSPFFIKEFLIGSGLIGYLITSEKMANEYVWRTVADDVKEYGLLKEKEFSDFSK